MMAHLSSAQLSEYILGQPNPMIAQHIESCPVCLAEVTQFRTALGEFRGAVRAWSEEQAGKYQEDGCLVSPSTVGEPHPGSPSRQLAWALVIAVVCVIASFIFPRRPAEKAAASDAVLLNQVDAQVSRTAPSSMEPLMRLVVENQ